MPRESPKRQLVYVDGARLDYADSISDAGERPASLICPLRSEPLEKTLIILKPDCVQRRLVGSVIQRFENKGLTLAAMKLMQITRELAEQHYAVHQGKPFYPGLDRKSVV